jgi:hypothetical protein
MGRGFFPNQANREMADYIFDFTLTGNKYYNGKVLHRLKPVVLTRITIIFICHI